MIGFSLQSFLLKATICTKIACIYIYTYIYIVNTTIPYDVDYGGRIRSSFSNDIGDHDMMLNPQEAADRIDHL